MKHWKYLIPVVIGLIITGCIPKRFEWSPNGKWMTVLSNAGLAICDSNGQLLPNRVPDVVLATWFPDSARLLIAKKHPVATWAELQPLLSPEQIQAVIDTAARLKTAAMAFDWTKGDAPAFDQSFDYRIDKDLKPAVALYLRDHADDQWNQKIPEKPRQDLANVTMAMTDVGICDLDASGPKAGLTLMTTVRVVVELRVSPTGKAAMLVTDKQDEDPMKHVSLWIVATDGSKAAVSLPDSSSWYPDWSPNGNDVVFATSSQSLSNDAALGTLRRERVIGDDGIILDSPRDAEDLAGMVYSPLTRVRCLPDGRIIFASAQLTLPATPNDLPQRLELFSLAPGKQATVSRLFPLQTVANIGDAAEYFEISPDGQWVSIPDDSGKIYVVELATGNVTAVQSEDFPKVNDQSGQLPTVPSWRAGNQLTFAAPDGQDHMKVMIRPMPGSPGSEKPISAGWPRNLLETHPPSDTQP